VSHLTSGPFLADTQSASKHHRQVLRNQELNSGKMRGSRGCVRARSKHLWVESSDPSESDCEDGNMLKQQPITLLPLGITVACHPTNIVIDQELIRTGYAEEQMSVPQVEAKVMEETKNHQYAGVTGLGGRHGWEESLWMAHRMQRVRAAALQDESTQEPSLCVRKLMQGQVGRILDKWKVYFLEN